MNFIKQEIENSLKNSDKEQFINIVSKDLDNYFKFYSILQFDIIKETLENLNKYNFFVIRGKCGAGKSSLKSIIENSLEKSVLTFEYNCNEITELDDIFLKIYKFINEHPQRPVLTRNPQENFKPSSIDEKIMHFFKRETRPLLFVLDNFEKLLDENGEFKAENIKSFLEFLSTIKNVRVVILTTVFVSGMIDIPAEILFKQGIFGLDEAQIQTFFKALQIDIPNSLAVDIKRETSGNIFALRFLNNFVINFALPVPEIFKEIDFQHTTLNEYMVKKIFSVLSLDAKKILVCLSLFRHAVSLNVLKVIERFENVQKAIDDLRKFMIIEGEKNLELRDFVKDIVLKNITDRDKLNLHLKIADFYAEQIPMKPKERLIDISRTTMYAEKFYHYNFSNKFEKNFEMQSKFKSDTFTLKKDNLSSKKIQYIAATKYLPLIEDVKPTKQASTTEQRKKEEKIERELDIPEDISLSAEEKALLSMHPDFVSQEDEKLSEEAVEQKESLSFDTDFVDELEKDTVNSIEAKELTDYEKGLDLFKKGVKNYNDSDLDSSISYLHSALGLFTVEDKETYENAKIYLAKALIDSLRYAEAMDCLLELVEHKHEITPTVAMDALIELSTIYEYKNDFEQALKCYNEATELAVNTQNKNYSAKIYFKEALFYDDRDDIDNALYYYLLAVTDALDSGEYSILASVYSNIASIYQERGDIQKAIEYYKKSLLEDEKTFNYEGQVHTLSTLGGIFYEKGNTNLAIKVYIKQTQAAKNSNDSYLIASSYLDLGDAFFNVQDFKNALKAYYLSKRNIDNTISTDSKNKIERRFEMVVNEIGERAYDFLSRELHIR